MKKKQIAGALLAATLVFPPSLAFAQTQDSTGSVHQNSADQGAVNGAATNNSVSTNFDELIDILGRKNTGEYGLQTGTALVRMMQAENPTQKLPFDVLQSETNDASSDYATMRVLKTTKGTYLVLTLKGTKPSSGSSSQGKSSGNYVGVFEREVEGHAGTYQPVEPLTTHDVQDAHNMDNSTDPVVKGKKYPKEILIPVQAEKATGKLNASLYLPVIAAQNHVYTTRSKVVLEWKDLKLDALYRKSAENIIKQAKELAEQDATSASDKAALKKVAEEATTALKSATKPEQIAEQINKLNDAIKKVVPQAAPQEHPQAPQAGSQGHDNDNQQNGQSGDSAGSGSEGGSGGHGGSAGGSEGATPEEPAVPSFDQATKRIAGETAEDTMQQIVQTAFPDPVDKVVLATSESYWDALSANSLAGSLNAPVLLTHHNQLPAQTIAELKRLKTSKVVVCGGENAISNDVVAQLKDLNIEVERIAGNMASDTANDIAKKLDKSDTAIVATSWGYEDALSAASFAYAKKAPIFLANYNSATLDVSSIQTMKDKGVKKVYIVGGTSVVSPEVEAQLSAAGITVERIAGQTAYDTSAKLATKLIALGMSANNMAIATGWGYTDALAGAALCGKQNSVMVLADNTNQTAINEVVAANKNAIQNYYIFGGTSVVGDGATDALKGVFTGKDA